MVWSGRFEYSVCVVVSIGVDVGRLFLRVYVVVPASVVIIIIIVVIVVIFSRELVLIVRIMV